MLLLKNNIFQNGKCDNGRQVPVNNTLSLVDNYIMFLHTELKTWQHDVILKKTEIE